MDARLAESWLDYARAVSAMAEAMGRTSNILGEFAEHLVAEFHAGRQLPASAKSADIETEDGTMIQVKARVPRQGPTTSLGIIRSWDFHVLAVVLFAPDGRVAKAVELPVATAQGLAKPNSLQNGWVIVTTREVLEHPDAVDITDGLNALIAAALPPTTRGEGVVRC
jgi:hypothetical protein